MKKLIAAAGTCLIAVSLVTPATADVRGREVTQDYTMSNGAFVGHGEAHWTLGAAYSVFKAEKDERRVSIAIQDAFGETVRGHVHINYNNGGKTLDDQVDFCGTTTEPIKVEPGSTIEVGTLMGFCDDNTPSIVTEGTVTATFSK